MKKHKLLFVAPVLSTSLLAPTISSCSIFEDIWTMPRAIDGSNWTGVLAGKFTSDDYYIDDEKQEIHYWNGESIIAEDLVIPNYVWYYGQKYKAIIDPICFENSATIIGSVELNDWMNDLPSYVFNNCGNITSITFHDYPTSLGQYSLYKCVNLTNIYVKKPGLPIDSDWTVNLEQIGNYALASTALAGSLVFTDSLRELGYNAFDDCKQIKTVNMRFCTELKVISQGCFTGCRLLTRISLPNSIEEIGDSAFISCTDLVEVILNDENQRIQLDDNAFRDCPRFVRFSSAPIVKKIGEACFYGDKSLEFAPWLDTRNSGLEIGMNAFADCGFCGVEFSPDVSIDVDSCAFGDCRQLRSIDFSSFKKNDPVPDWVGEDIFTSTIPDGRIVISQDIWDNMNTGSGEWTYFFLESTGAYTLFENGWKFKIK